MGVAALGNYQPQTFTADQTTATQGTGDPGKVGSGNNGTGGGVPDAGKKDGSEGTSGLTPTGKAVLGAEVKFLEQILTGIRSSSGNSMNFLARVMIEQEGQQRHDAVAERTAMRQLARASLLSAAGELNKQADAMQQAAIISLVVTCVTAALSMAASAVGTGIGMKGSVGEAASGSQLQSATSKLGGFFSAAAQSATKMGEAGANFASTEGQVEVKKSEAAQKIDEANAQQYDAQADLKKGMMEALDHMLQELIAFLKNQQDSTAERFAAFTKC